MPLILSDVEQSLITRIPEGDLIDLAAELELIIPEKLDRTELVIRSLDALIQRARQEGLPLSQYDQEDIEALSHTECRVLAELMGSAADARSMVKSGQKTFKKHYRKRRPGSQVPLLLPMLLPMLARHALSLQ